MKAVQSILMLCVCVNDKLIWHTKKCISDIAQKEIMILVHWEFRGKCPLKIYSSIISQIFGVNFFAIIISAKTIRRCNFKSKCIKAHSKSVKTLRFSGMVKTEPVFQYSRDSDCDNFGPRLWTVHVCE